MKRHLLFICNSRSAIIAIHELDLARRAVTLRREVALPVPAGENSASPMVLSADGRLLYLPWRGAEKKLLTYSVSPDLADIEIIGSMPLVDDICYLHVDPSGQRLLGAGGSNVVVIPVGDRGLPLPVRERIEVGPLAHCVLVDGTGRILASSCRGDSVRVLSGDVGTGELVFARDLKQPTGSGPRHMCRSPDGRRVYLVSQESGEVVVLNCEATLLEVQRTSMVVDLGADFAPMGGDIAITPDGRFVYATERTSNRLVSYAVDPLDGTLQCLGFVATPDYPRAFGIDPTGTFLTVLGFRGHRAAVLAIGADGHLAPIADFATGERPSWVVSLQCS